MICPLLPLEITSLPMPINLSALDHRPMRVESLSVALPEFGERCHSADGRIDGLVANMTD